MRAASAELEVRRCFFAALPGDLKGDLLTLVEPIQSRSGHSGEVNKHALAAILRLNEAGSHGTGYRRCAADP